MRCRTHYDSSVSRVVQESADANKLVGGQYAGYRFSTPVMTANSTDQDSVADQEHLSCVLHNLLKSPLQYWFTNNTTKAEIN
jgi:uncharacterized protein YccT (UPF0319 family)